MRYINVLDEFGRFVYLKILPNESDGQQDSHTLSYMGLRKSYREVYNYPVKMGIEQLPEQKNDLEDRVK